MEDKTNKIILTVDVVSAFLGHNPVAADQLPALIHTVYAALAGAGASATPVIEPVAKPTPAQIRKSITQDALISFEDGKPYRTLKRHLAGRGLTLVAYKDKWGLPDDYPSTAPSYSAARSAMAKALGLGRGGRKPSSKSRAKSA